MPLIKVGIRKNKVLLQLNNDSALRTVKHIIENTMNPRDRD